MTILFKKVKRKDFVEALNFFYTMLHLSPYILLDMAGQGQVWFDAIASPRPGPVCTFSCLYISALAEFY